MESKPEGEIYLGGITSPELMVSGFPGNGIHVTNRRLILVRTKGGFSGNLLGVFGGGGLLGGIRSAKLSGRAASQKIRELEKRMYYEASKENIVSLELKAPGRERWSRLRIVSKTLEPMDVGMTALRDYEVTKELLATFYPEMLKIV